MAVSKRLRYEVLRRDNYTCRYCGARAPEAKLTVDHVIPTTLSGSDEPSNLVAACADCNSGKSSTSPDAPLIAGVQHEAERWATAMRMAVEEQANQRPQPRRDLAGEELVEHFDGIWTRYWMVGDHDQRIHFTRPTNWRDTVRSLVTAGLTLSDFGELVKTAVYSGADDTWRYFCRCGWNRLGEYQQRAGELIRSGAA